MTFLDPLVSFDLNTQKFIQDPSKTTAHNIQALERLIELDVKEKETLFQQMGKNFFNRLGEITTQFPRNTKD